MRIQVKRRADEMERAAKKARAAEPVLYRWGGWVGGWGLHGGVGGLHAGWGGCMEGWGAACSGGLHGDVLHAVGGCILQF